MSIDPELRLAVAACHTTFAERPAGEIEPLTRTVNWDRFLMVAKRHRIQALCWHGLKPIRDAIPAAVAEPLQIQAGAIVEANLRIAAESARLFALYRSAGLQLLYLKGLTLDALAYPIPFLKMGWDIDLLVAPESLPEAAQLLRSAGYTSVVPAAGRRDLEDWHRSRKESVWHRPEGGFHVDLHTRLADNPALLPKLGTNSPSRMVAIAGGIELPTLGKDELFAYLSVHGASSAWFRLKWITDVAALLHGQAAKEIERLYKRSQQLGAGRAAAQALILADRLYGIAMSNELCVGIGVDHTNRWLARVAERQIEAFHEPTEILFGTASIHLSQPFLMPGWRFKLSEIARQLNNMLGATAR
jgi:hypothetical protein